MISLEAWYREAVLEREFEEAIRAYWDSEKFEDLLLAGRIALRANSPEMLGEVQLALVDQGYGLVDGLIPRWEKHYQADWPKSFGKENAETSVEPETEDQRFFLFLPREPYMGANHYGLEYTVVTFTPSVAETIQRGEPVYIVEHVEGPETELQGVLDKAGIEQALMGTPFQMYDWDNP